MESPLSPPPLPDFAGIPPLSIPKEDLLIERGLTSHAAPA
jgi:hypothetical protein